MIKHEILVAFRSLRKAPRFVLAVTFTLALGIGANTAIFSVADAMLLRRLPQEREASLVHISEVNPAEDDPVGAASPADLKAIAERTDLFSDVAASVSLTAALVHGRAAEEVEGSEVTPNYLPLMGLRTELGRGFTAADLSSQGEKTLILSHQFWQSRFGGRQDILGRSVRLNEEDYVVIGVMPPNSGASREGSFWIPFSLEADASNRVMYLDAIGRLRDGVSLPKAQAAVDVIARRLAQEFPESNAGYSVRLRPFRRHLVGSFWTPLVVLAGAAGFILLITCANVANLLLARAADRQTETAIRKSLGASNMALGIHSMAEALLLAILGAVVALPLSVWLVDLLRAFGPPDIWQMRFVSVNWRVLAFGLGAGVSTVFLFAAAPTWWVSRIAPQAFLKGAPQGETRLFGRRGLGSALVVSEVALSVPLLVGAALMLSSLWRLDHVDVGLARDKLVVGQIWLSRQRYPLTAQRREFFEKVLDRIRQSPEIEAASMVSFSPITPSGGERRSFVIQGTHTTGSGQKPEARFKVVDSEYLRVLEVPLLKGRAFTESDRAESEHVAMVSRSFARHYLGEVEAIDQRLLIDFPGRVDTVRIVGIVGDVTSWPEVKVEPTIYVPFLQDPVPMMSVLVRSRSSFEPVAEAIREEVGRVDPEQPVREVSTMKAILDERLRVTRFVSLLLQMFGTLAALLAACGTYGVISCLVANRRREIAIRSALGAGPTSLIALFAGQSLRWSLMGGLIGSAGAVALTRLLRSLLYGITPTDPLALILGAGVLVGVCLLGASIPALKASRIPPAESLRAP